MRFHRFEVYTPFPVFTDFSRVDCVLFVSPHVHRLPERLSPGVNNAGRIVTVDNFLSRVFGPEISGSADRKQLAQVGWIKPVKDVVFTLDVLEELRAEDPEWSLVLVGPGLNADPARDTPYERD